METFPRLFFVVSIYAEAAAIGRCYLQEGGAGQKTAVTEIGSSHHVPGVKHLLGELGDRCRAE